MVRLVENNDWVVLCLLGAGLAYVIVFKTLHREISLPKFLTQDISDANNTFLGWVFTSIVFCLSLSLLLSQYIPIVPKFVIENFQLLGYHLNKFGFMFISLLIFYLLKTIISYLFYANIGELKKWPSFYFITNKFYFVLSLFIMMLCVVQYFLIIDRNHYLPIYVAGLGVIFVFKIFFYLFNNLSILPREWYYKILYICTLQILPNLVLWKFLFL